MKWIKLTGAEPSREPVLVNLDNFVEMRAGNMTHTDYKTTRLYTGHLAYAADCGIASKEYYYLDVMETPEEILRLLQTSA